MVVMHGCEDDTVPLRQTEMMSRALARAGKPVRTVLLDDADHYFTRTPDRVRVLQTLVSSAPT